MNLSGPLVILHVGRIERIIMQKPYSLEIINEISVVRFFKKPTLSETLDAMDEVAGGGVTSKRLWIFQFGAKYTTPELGRIAQHSRKILPNPARAAIVVPNDLSFGLARMHEVFSESVGRETHVFRREQEAIVWLKDE